MASDYLSRLRRNTKLRVDRLEDRTAPASFQGLGDLPGGDFQSRANAVSSDGSVVVGESNSAFGYHEAFRWTPASGIVGLGDLPGGSFDSAANRTSADGSVVVGYGSGVSGQTAFRWTTNGMAELNSLPGGGSASGASGVSADGSVVVGHGTEAFRWTAASGIVGLGDLPGGTAYNHTYGVSADGNVIVGFGNSATGQEAFRWTAASGMIGLGYLPGGGPTQESTAYAASSDGSVIVGQNYFEIEHLEAFRWTAVGGMVSLGTLPGGIVKSGAYGVSSDGAVIVGGDSGAGAFLWTPASGMRSLRDVLITDYGLASQLVGWTLNVATGCSANGRVVVGVGTNPSGKFEAWIARLGPPSVQAVMLNDGSAQRSRVTNLTVTFNESVNLPANPANAFQLTRQSDNAPVPLTASVSGNSVTLMFGAGPTVDHGSLADGRYTMTVLASQVNNGNFDGNGDGIIGDDYTLVGNPTTGPRLFRLYGDSDGDGSVAANDFIAFRLALGSMPSFTFDFDNDGSVAASDFIQFRLRFGGTISIGISNE